MKNSLGHFSYGSMSSLPDCEFAEEELSSFKKAIGDGVWTPALSDLLFTKLFV